jgi:hypothetical protein
VITVDELKQRGFIVRDIAPHGDCIVIPGAKFDPDWEAELADQGYNCFLTNLGSEAVTLVSLKKSIAERPLKVVRRQGVRPGTKMKPWTGADCVRLMKRWDELKGYQPYRALKLTEEFPGRTATSITLKHQKLAQIYEKEREERDANGRFQAKTKPEKSHREGNVVFAAPAGPEPPTPEPAPVLSEVEVKRRLLVPSINTNVNISIQFDCSNLAAVEALLQAFLKFQKELSS